MVQKRLGKLPFSPPVGSVVILSLAAVIVAFVFVFYRIWVSEQTAAIRESRFVVQMYDRVQSSMLAALKPYAASDAAYRNVSIDFDLPWVEQRFGRDMGAETNFSAVFMIAPDDSIAFQDLSRDDLPQTIERSDMPSVWEAAETIRNAYLAEVRTRTPSDSNFSGKLRQLSEIHALRWGEHIALAASYAVVPDPGAAPLVDEPPYILTALCVLDPAKLSRISPNVSLVDVSEASSIRADQNALLITDQNGAPLGYITWPPMGQGTRIIVAAAPLLVLLILTITWLSWRVVRSNAAAQEKLAEIALQSRYDADHDNLTGFSLRDHFFARATAALEAHSTELQALVYLDLDNLKHVNDTWGHAAGDHLVHSVANRITDRLGTHQIAGRIGGDEFLILVSGFAQQAEIEAQFREVLLALKQPLRFEGHLIETSASAGVAYFPEHGSTIEELVRAADVALNRSKDISQFGIAVFDPTMDASLKENRDLRADLQKAVQNGELELFYQPIICAQHGKPTHAEALLRWNHPSRGRIPPDRFLPLAEASGLMPEISRWVTQTAIKDAAEWPMDFGVNINVNTSQLLNAGFPQEIGTLLAQSKLPPDQLTIEITEREILDRIDDTKSVQKELTDIGVRFALDDFGTGYSSLSYLHLYDFQTLKIDKSFLSGPDLSEDAKGLLSTMINLGQVLGMTVVVEGVETKEQHDFLTESGCSELQGFLFAKPMPLSELTALYGRQSKSG
ncbi:bifunctional diguanylate cyclase/phosphodiesterase [Shimia sp. R10_1]|uniref:putative bifunctional diguanylate cyclase/phosphodiesterase n=1 Tax=Shimia sp. R10_1 TaxID=2821095 RepID=UPI001ADC3EDB|nr:bifunctional diguanylate cyclase/phosphodiesterase [Shimia sp. R10_1]MBO9473039.1 bifunctional diguanylate cyclase/phosphodiesterase [Shimia sp. R10_1]